MEEYFSTILDYNGFLIWLGNYNSYESYSTICSLYWLLHIVLYFFVCFMIFDCGFTFLGMKGVFSRENLQLLLGALPAGIHFKVHS